MTRDDSTARGVGHALREIYPPDGSADDAIVRLIEKLGGTWPVKGVENEADRELPR